MTALSPNQKRSLTSIFAFVALLAFLAIISIIASNSQTVDNPSADLPPFEMTGPGAPTNAQGRDGDAWIDTVNWRLYTAKSGGAWSTYITFPQTARVTTATDGTYTFVYPVAYGSGIVPVCQAVAQATAGSTDVLNVQIDGAPTNTQMKVRVTRTQQSVVALLGLTILSIPASVGATPVSISCVAQ